MLGGLGDVSPKAYVFCSPSCTGTYPTGSASTWWIHRPNLRVLDPFKGAVTPHARIALNHGICGGAASMVVEEVNSDPRYLACSPETKSKIVKGNLAGELDRDNHFPAAFTLETSDWWNTVPRWSANIFKSPANES